jgi:iron complex outermembrane recepter protein
MRASGKDRLRLAIWAVLSLGASAPALAQNGGTDPPNNPDANPAPPQGTASTAAAGSDTTTSLDTVVVTGSTSKRTLLNASVDVTVANEADLQQKAPRSTADVLELVPGIFVEGTAGPVSNNYSVRGLPGGGQSFIMLQEDGMPIIYGGGGADE